MQCSDLDAETYTCFRMVGETVGQLDGWTIGRTVGRMVGWSDGRFLTVGGTAEDRHLS